MKTADCNNCEFAKKEESPCTDGCIVIKGLQYIKWMEAVGLIKVQKTAGGLQIDGGV